MHIKTKGELAMLVNPEVEREIQDKETFKKQSKLKYNAIEIEVQEQFLERLPKGIETVKERLKEWVSVEKFFLGRHWLDLNKQLLPTAPHYHIYIKFKDEMRVTQGTLMNKLHKKRVNEDNYRSVRKEEENNIICIDFRNFRSIRSNFAACYDYLYHLNLKDYEYKRKHLYTKDEMSPYFYCYGIDEADLVNDTEQQNGSIKTEDELIDEYVEKVSSGELDYYHFYIDPESKIPDSDFRIVEKHLRPIFARHMEQLVDSYNRVGHKMNIVYIYGDSETCKSYFAKKYGYSISDSVYFTNNSNHPFDDYKGQKVVVYNDWRPEDLPYSKLLNLLDPFNWTNTHARYHDVGLLCETFIITTEKSVQETYKELQGNAVNQLKRRCSLVYHFAKDVITEYHWDNDKKHYVQYKRYKNTFIDEVAELSLKIDVAPVISLSEKISSTMNLQVSDTNNVISDAENAPDSIKTYM